MLNLAANGIADGSAFCDALVRFICESCAGALDKYVIIDQRQNYFTALEICKNEIGTSVASIHDHNYTKLLCEYYSGAQDGCWIVLDRLNNKTNLTSFNQSS